MIAPNGSESKFAESTTFCAAGAGGFVDDEVAVGEGRAELEELEVDVTLDGVPGGVLDVTLDGVLGGVLDVTLDGGVETAALDVDGTGDVVDAVGLVVVPIGPSTVVVDGPTMVDLPQAGLLQGPVEDDGLIRPCDRAPDKPGVDDCWVPGVEPPPLVPVAFPAVGLLGATVSVVAGGPATAGPKDRFAFAPDCAPPVGVTGPAAEDVAGEEEDEGEAEEEDDLADGAGVMLWVGGSAGASTKVTFLAPNVSAEGALATRFARPTAPGRSIRPALASMADQVGLQVPLAVRNPARSVTGEVPVTRKLTWRSPTSYPATEPSRGQLARTSAAPGARRSMTSDTDPESTATPAA